MAILLKALWYTNLYKSLKYLFRNLKNAKRQTNQVAEETKKMEVRLQELKLAMAHEKEEREYDYIYLHQFMCAIK